MKVLWFAGNPGLYANNNKYNGGGWIGALQRELMKSKASELDIEIAFPWSCNFEEQGEEIKYYGIKRMRHSFWNYTKKQNKEYIRIKEIINISQPDIIHVFGSEFGYGMASMMTDVPVIIHLQGILTSYKNFWMPQGISWFDYIVGNPRNYIIKLALDNFVKRERKILSCCNYFMGRTEWDKATISMLSPNGKYFYCSEMLRPEIYESKKVWHRHVRDKKKIVSIISGSPYKGGDIILKVAYELKLCWGDNFEWTVYGIDNMSFFEKVAGIRSKEVNVKEGGVITAAELVDIVTNCDVYVHPSYIENSPNTVCEAQLLGAPVLVTNVGGVTSLVEDNVNGMLVPSGDVCIMTAKLVRLFKDDALCERLGSEGRKVALERHNPRNIVRDLTNIYKVISGKE